MLSVLSLLLSCAGSGAAFAQSEQPAMTRRNIAIVAVLGDGARSCTEVSRAVEKERALRPKDAPKNSAAVPEYVMFGSFANGAWTAMNNMNGPLAGEKYVNHVVGEDLDFDQRMDMLHAYCVRNPDDNLYGAVLAVRRDLVNNR